MGARAIKPDGSIRTAPAAAIGLLANTRGTFFVLSKKRAKRAGRAVFWQRQNRPDSNHAFVCASIEGQLKKNHLCQSLFLIDQTDPPRKFTPYFITALFRIIKNEKIDMFTFGK